ncbi:clan AA aspartic protease [Turneriella parva]|uniref:Clan AA aspartic protease, AF_0612 family n=1 Tax=Turneriella parva (strain ATCC BAA-1111 / DSM 21527 / NCTC 11395 / H) TaxID=869212 RepID=I4B0Q1_TURPD|nr:clan AA aspartic protease [Turneriella parva]AFM10858.1 clan AA aspartic protease, AF_0612 family [Turneriella parva DSM 21527]
MATFRAAPLDLVYATIELSNPRDASLSPLSTDALVDTGAFMLCIPEHVRIQLNLAELEKREVTLADHKKVLCPYVGPVQIRFANRSCFTGALVLGEKVLLGAIPLEDMDLLVHPLKQQLVVNPESPNIASGLVM